MKSEYPQGFQVDFTGRVWMPKECLVNLKRITQEVFGEYFNYFHVTVEDTENVWCHIIAGSFYAEGVIANLEVERWIHQIEREVGEGVRYSLKTVTPWER